MSEKHDGSKSVHNELNSVENVRIPHRIGVSMLSNELNTSHCLSPLCSLTNHHFSIEESSFSIEESSFLNEIHLQLAKFYRVLSPILYVRTVILQPEMKILQYKASCPLRDIRSQEGSCQDSKTQAEAGCCSRSTHNDARRWLGLWSRPCDAALWHYFRVEHPLHVERTEVQDCNRKQSVNQRNPWKLD